MNTKKLDTYTLERIHILLTEESLHWNEESEGISFSEYFNQSNFLKELVEKLSELEFKYKLDIKTKFPL